MEAASLCLLLSATLSIRPDKSQFFQHENVHVTCAAPTHSSGWTLMGNNSFKRSRPCDGGDCQLRDVFRSDTGAYWCQSERGECSGPVNVTVTAGVVILKSPALPVMEGDEVTLQCLYKERSEEKSSSAFNATFYRNEAFMGSELAGKMVLVAASRADEGFYRCEHPTKGKSPESWLSVAARPQRSHGPRHPRLEPPLRLLCTVLLFGLYSCILAACIHLYRRRARARADNKRSDHLVLE
ncbi:low affinity immunoglobulin gamma Fc region receptor II-like [Clinocottus analis]|uniref:low affinity immunoglobulin gamma Fc region receptor II-like n=1 Tax=Clinocottus analis TaxID=304258 RepID=UPI0035C1F936